MRISSWDELLGGEDSDQGECLSFNKSINSQSARLLAWTGAAQCSQAPCLRRPLIACWCWPAARPSLPPRHRSSEDACEMPSPRPHLPRPLVGQSSRALLPAAPLRAQRRRSYLRGQAHTQFPWTLFFELFKFGCVPQMEDVFKGYCRSQILWH